MYIWIYEIKNAPYIMHIEMSVRFKEFLIYVHCAQMHMLKILTVYTLHRAVQLHQDGIGNAKK